MSAKSIPALGLEKEYGEKIDRCVTDTLLKAGAGLLVGGVFSLVLFKRRAWPVTLGTGIGLGIAYRNCEDNLRSHYLKEEGKEQTSPIKSVTQVEKINVEQLDSIEEANIKAGFEEVKAMSDTLVSNNTAEELPQSEDDRNMLNKNF